MSLLNSGRITLAGPDVADIGRGLVPFGRVVLIAGREMGDSIQPKLDSKLAAAEQLPGYMVRSTGGNIWARVSHEALEDAFSLHKVGANIVDHLRTVIPTVEAVEILFVTSSDEDVTELERIGAQVRKLSHDLRRRRIKDLGGGEYECEKDITCEACPENDVCIEIRQVLRLQKKNVQQ
jgi:CO dehydrogenase/acetyl-CoA synthase beta subunit